ncbi:uncharacterized protein LOC129310967 isoform X2 [Prosopis cineraria]|uniref:uncharacterized protein LOC129310967 isoform X2 n=1 Tax=Prosopis cineraria TaxID=364024 RepID=UPI00240F84C3|nr:uncharacterized protein LOC129310967 isoform X2 [Prosopis cineraria]
MTPEVTMAEEEEEEEYELKNLASSYIGISFSLFLAFLPKNLLPLFQKFGSQLKELSAKLFQAEEQLKQMKSRRQEDSKANARVVEIFAGHRNAWQAEEKRLLHQIDACSEEIAYLRARVEEFEKCEVEWKARIEDLERVVREKEEMLNLISRREQEEDEESGECEGRDYGGGAEKVEVIYEQIQQYQKKEKQFESEFLTSASKYWAERGALWQDVQHESLESTYDMKHFVGRESPWKVDGDSAGVYSKLKLLEEELLSLEKIGKCDLSKVPSLTRKQAKRYHTLAEKIDDLCRRIASDHSEPALSSEFQMQRQTELLLEAFRLQQQASEAGQKLMALQTETGKSYGRDELITPTTRRAMDSIKNNMKEIQRNLEIWLARIIGDLEGILARDVASRMRDCYTSRYPFIQ